MNKTLKNKKGMGLPIVLAITSFFIVSIFVLTTAVLYQTKAVEADFKYQEEYSLAQTKISATASSIIRHNDLSDEFLDEISSFMNVEITKYDSQTIMISSDLTNGSLVKSYLSGATESISLTDEYLDNDGFEDDFELNPLITPASLLSSYMKQFFSNNFSGISFTGDFADIDSIVEYIGDLASRNEGYIEVNKKVLTNSNNPTVNGHWYIDGNVKLTNKTNLIIPEGYILFIDGDLTLKRRAVLKGNVVVNGNVTIKGDRRKYETVEATIYLSGDFDGSYKMYLGDKERPTFIFSEGSIEFQKYTSGYAYLLANEVEGYSSWWSGDTTIKGGVYSDDVSGIFANTNPDLDEDDLYDLGVSQNVNDSSSGASGFIYTYPK